MAENLTIIKKVENTFEKLVFWSRWLQAPIYFGLVVGAALYVYKFFNELMHLALTVDEINEITVMLYILGLIDISMVMNLLIIVIIGGYTIFVSKIDFSDEEDKPQWLDNIDAGILKIKLASSLASISGVHLLKTFIDIHEESAKSEFNVSVFYGVVIEIIIHIVFIVSALLLAYVERILHDSHRAAHDPEIDREIKH
ncbi:MAG: TIGR00645 family protein [Cytophagales bacterium]|nr:TIGR00645 family protein [Cytophagales bacterium]